MGLFTRMKLNKIKRSEVVDSIIELNKQVDELTGRVEDNNKQTDELFEKGKKSRDKDEKLYYAKRINTLKAENKQIYNRLMYLNANISMLNQLKHALDEKEFIKVNKKMTLNKLMSKPADLQKFLLSLNTNKMVNEEKMAETMDIFEGANAEYSANDKIFGENESDNELLAMFEYANMEDSPKEKQQEVEKVEEKKEEQPEKTRKRVMEDAI